MVHSHCFICAVDGITKFEISWANQFAVWCICSDNTVKLSVVAAFPGPHTSFCHSQYHLYQSASDRKLDNILGMRPCPEWPWQPSSLLLLIPVVAKWTHPLSRQLRMLVPWKPTIDWFQWIGNWISIFHFFVTIIDDRVYLCHIPISWPGDETTYPFLLTWIP